MFGLEDPWLEGGGQVVDTSLFFLNSSQSYDVLNNLDINIWFIN